MANTTQEIGRLKDEQAREFLISDALWEKIRPLLPKHRNTHRFGGGRPRQDDRTCLNGILFVLRTGCQWKALSATGICPSSTAHDRFQQWVAAGLFLKLWKAGLMEYDQLKGIDWAWLSMDGVMTKAPLGGEKIGTQSHRSSQKGRQTLAADRGRRGAAGPGGGRGQPSRLPVAGRHFGEHAH